MHDDPSDKPLVWLAARIHTPPFDRETRVEAGVLLRRLQRGESLAMPHARPMPSLGWRCFELRIRGPVENWRIVLRVDPDAIVIVDVFAKTTRATPHLVLERCRRRLRRYDADCGGRT
ncbi:MAG: type II toxin-antitoxin system RelE/ParE family toxin [Planctomycetes bacterium]|nr:type II toxin-antitoxin system RelE/ParE family toxin [Planctomycetota bacterium]